MLKVICKYKEPGEDIREILISSFLLYVKSELTKYFSEPIQGKDI